MIRIHGTREVTPLIRFPRHGARGEILRLRAELEAERALTVRLRERIDLVAPGGMTTDGGW